MKSNKEMLIKLLKEMEMRKKYTGIKAYVYGSINVTNDSNPNVTKANYIGAYEALNTLKMLERTVDEDIKAFKLSDLDIKDIFTKREKEISQYIYGTFFESNPYRWNDIQKKYALYLKIKKLEKVYPIEQRKKDLQDKANEIERLEEIIMHLEASEDAFDTSLSMVYSKKRQLEQLKREYAEQEQLVNFETPEDLAVELYNTVYSKMNEIKELILNKINYLERVLEV